MGLSANRATTNTDVITTSMQCVKLQISTNTSSKACIRIWSEVDIIYVTFTIRLQRGYSLKPQIKIKPCFIISVEARKFLPTCETRLRTRKQLKRRHSGNTLPHMEYTLPVAFQLAQNCNFPFHLPVLEHYPTSLDITK